jgi:hypothetical protein
MHDMRRDIMQHGKTTVKLHSCVLSCSCCVSSVDCFAMLLVARLHDVEWEDDS